MQHCFSWKRWMKPAYEPISYKSLSFSSAQPWKGRKSHLLAVVRSSVQLKQIALLWEIGLLHSKDWICLRLHWKNSLFVRISLILELQMNLSTRTMADCIIKVKYSDMVGKLTFIWLDYFPNVYICQSVCFIFFLLLWSFQRNDTNFRFIKGKINIYSQQCTVFLGWNRTWNRSYRIGAQFLGLLCAVLLTAIIILYVENKRLQNSRNDLTEQKAEYLDHTNEHQVRYKNLSLEKEQLENSLHHFQVRYNSMVEENDLFRAITANLTKEKIQLQTLNSNLVKEKDRFRILSNNLAREINQSETRYKAMADQRDKIQNWYNNMTDEKNRLQICNLVEERRKLQCQNDNLTKERDQVHLEMGGLQKALSNFGEHISDFDGYKRQC